MLDLTGLNAIVTKLQTDVNAAIPLISNPKADQDAVDAIVSQLTSTDTPLAAAVEAANPAPQPPTT